MSVIRRIGKAVFALLFTAAMLAAVSMLSLVGFTQYDNVKGMIGSILDQEQSPLPLPQLSEQDKSNIVQNLQSQCQGKDSISVSMGIGNFDVKCSEIASLSPSGLTGFISSKVADSVYYRKYDCDFLSCLRSEQPVPLLITGFANDFYRMALVYAIVAAAALGAVFVALCDGIAGRLKGPGFALFWSGMPLVAASVFMDRIVQSVAPQQLVSLVQPVVSEFFSPSFYVYVCIMLAGTALIAAGYAVEWRSRRGKKR